MTKIKICATIVLAIVLATPSLFSQQKSDKEAIAMLEKAYRKIYKTAYSTKIKTTIKSPTDSQTEVHHMNIRLWKDMFCMTIADVEVYYDGKTQWNFDRELNETTILTPTAKELAMVSPIAMIYDYKKRYRIDFQIPKIYDGHYDILLMPIDRADNVFLVRVLMRTTTNEISRIEVSMRDGGRILFEIGRYKKIDANVNLFQWDATKHPEAFVNDLR